MSKSLENRIAKLENKTAANHKIATIEIGDKTLQISQAELSKILHEISRTSAGLPNY